MYTWTLIGLAVVVVLAARRIYIKRRSRPKNIFLQNRPAPDLGSAADTSDAARVRTGLEGLGNAPPKTAATPKDPKPIARSVPTQSPSAAAPPRSPALTASVSPAASKSSDLRSAQSGSSRSSTWEGRRLFSDFRGILSEDARRSVPIEPEELPMRDDDLVFGPLTPSLAQLLPESAARREIQRKSLVAAGYRSRGSWLNLTAIRLTLAFLAVVIVGFWLIIAPPQFEIPLLVLLIVSPLTMWALPPLLVAAKSAARKIDIERGLPDLLDMLNMGVSQGLTVPQALRRISSEISQVHPALAEELRIVSCQTEVGSLTQALKNFGQRIDSVEVNSFTSLLIQTDATGASVSHALTAYSDSIRSTLKERADARANAASFKMLFPVSLCLMPSVFLFLLGPAIVDLSDFFGSKAAELDANRESAMDRLQQPTSVPTGSSPTTP